MSTRIDFLTRFVEVYNDCWSKGFGYVEVARQLKITRKEAVQLAYDIRKAERARKENESCLKGKLSKLGRITMFLEGRRSNGD